MNYNRFQVELLRKAIGTLASARFGGLQDNPPFQLDAAPAPSLPATVTSLPPAPEPSRKQERAARFFTHLEWSGAGTDARPKGAANLDDSPPSAQAFFGSLAWETGGTTKISKQPQLPPAPNIAVAPPSDAVGIGSSANTFFAALPWSAASKAPGTTTAILANAPRDHASLADFASLATSTALASASRKVAS